VPPAPTFSVSDGSWTKEGNKIYNSNDGNVGIGTTNPTSKLDVAGNMNVSGNVVVSGYVTAPLRVDKHDRQSKISFVGKRV
jgi:hypothetical protein